MKWVDVYEDKFAKRRRMAIVVEKKAKRGKIVEIENESEIVSMILSDRNSVSIQLCRPSTSSSMYKTV